MGSVNQVMLLGNLGRDPELRYTPKGTPVANLSIATSRRWKDNGETKEATDWHRVVVWGKQAEVVKEYLAKGREVYIEGRIDNRSYDDKDGNKRYISEVVAENVRFLGSRGDQPSSGGNAGGAPPPAPPSGGAADDDDLPF